MAGSRNSGEHPVDHLERRGTHVELVPEPMFRLARDALESRSIVEKMAGIGYHLEPGTLRQQPVSAATRRDVRGVALTDQQQDRRADAVKLRNDQVDACSSTHDSANIADYRRRGEGGPGAEPTREITKFQTGEDRTVAQPLRDSHETRGQQALV